MCTLNYWSISYYYHLLLRLLVISVSSIFWLLCIVGKIVSKDKTMITSEELSESSLNSKMPNKCALFLFIFQVIYTATNKIILLITTSTVSVVVVIIIIVICLVVSNIVYLKKKHQLHEVGGESEKLEIISRTSFIVDHKLSLIILHMMKVCCYKLIRFFLKSSHSS